MLHPSTRRAVRWALNLAIVGGVALAVSPSLQSAYGWWSQRQLLARWDASAGARPQLQRRVNNQAATQKRSAKNSAKKNAAKNAAQLSASAITMSGQSREARAPLPPTRLRISSLGVDAIVVPGLDEKALARGPGHDPRSALPGEKGNCVLAAHRNVYGSWFYRLDELAPGATIDLESDGQNFRYSVISVTTVAESDSSVLRSAPNSAPILTLITCTLPHSPFRIVATAYIPQ